MIQGSLARRYARALIEVAVETNALEDVRADVEEFFRLWQESEVLRTALGQEMVPLAERAKALDAVLAAVSLKPTTANFIRLLLSKKRLVLLPEIVTQLRILADRRSNILRAKVRSAAPLSNEILDGLRKRLATSSGQRVEIDVQVDPSLLAGLVAEVGHTVVDGSVATQLQRMKRELIEKH